MKDFTLKMLLITNLVVVGSIIAYNVQAKYALKQKKFDMIEGIYVRTIRLVPDLDQRKAVIIQLDANNKLSDEKVVELLEETK